MDKNLNNILPWFQHNIHLMLVYLVFFYFRFSSPKLKTKPLLKNVLMRNLKSNILRFFLNFWNKWISFVCLWKKLTDYFLFRFFQSLLGFSRIFREISALRKVQVICVTFYAYTARICNAGFAISLSLETLSLQSFLDEVSYSADDHGHTVDTIGWWGIPVDTIGWWDVLVDTIDWWDVSARTRTF